MKKLLPKSINNPQGFTLIELLVVVAIIAILSVIGYGIFAGAQGSAKDGRRRVEIDQLAKNIESTREASTGNYLYDTTRGVADYPSGLTDPTAGNVYCYAVVTTTSTPPADPVNFTTACPTDPTGTPVWLALGGSPFTVAVAAGANNDLADPSIKGWKVCAGLERTPGPVCKGNILR